MLCLRPNLVLRGDWRKATYTALRMIRKDCPRVWLGRRFDTYFSSSKEFKYLLTCISNHEEHVILKEARDDRSFSAEVNALNGYLLGHSSFRQLVDLVPEQKIMVYEHLSENLHHVLYSRPQRKLEDKEVKNLTRVILKGLATMHKEGIAHTGIDSAPAMSQAVSCTDTVHQTSDLII